MSDKWVPVSGDKEKPTSKAPEKIYRRNGVASFSYYTPWQQFFIEVLTTVTAALLAFFAF